MTYLEVLVSIAGLFFGYVVIWAFTRGGSENDQMGSKQEKDREPEGSNFENSEKKKEESSKSDQSSQNESGDIEVRVFSCPSCAQKIRVRLPLPKGTGKCTKCKNWFGIYIDEHENLYITETKRSSEKAYEETGMETVEECLALLGLTSSASPLEIRSAYRAKIGQYHPDKVSHLGENLRSLANYESKRLNHAYSLLKEHGYLKGG